MTCSRSVILPLHVAAMQINLIYFPDDAVNIMMFKQQHEQTKHNKQMTNQEPPQNKSTQKIQCKSAVNSENNTD
jgi:hypothetical protein